MANTNSPFGLRPWTQDGSTKSDFAVNIYAMSSSDANAVYIGDPVIVTGTGNTDGVPYVAKATAGSGAYFTGVVVGVIPTTDESTVYRAASTECLVLVADDPNQLFEIQSNGTAAVTALGANADFSFGSGGSTASGQSGGVLAESTVDTTNTLQLRIERFSPVLNNEIGAYGKYIVRINLHQKRNLTGI